MPEGDWKGNPWVEWLIIMISYPTTIYLIVIINVEDSNSNPMHKMFIFRIMQLLKSFYPIQFSQSRTHSMTIKAWKLSLLDWI